jgi:hypothetical protein
VPLQEINAQLADSWVTTQMRGRIEADAARSQFTNDIANSNTHSNGPRQIQITVPVSGVQVDGQTIGRLAAPHVEEYMIDGISVAVQVVDAAATPGLAQPGFRQV